VPGFQDQIVISIPRLRRFCVAVTGTLTDGDDLLQSTVERALKRRETYDPKQKIESWLFKIAQNLWIDLKRKEARRGPMTDISEMHHIVGEDGRSVVENRATTRDILGHIAALPEPQRLVVAHVLVDGQSYKETAKLLGVPVGTIMSRLNRARKTLEALILDSTDHTAKGSAL
jgi:RNA polymerase sigma-70 factor, ECF subfamily